MSMFEGQASITTHVTSVELAERQADALERIATALEVLAWMHPEMPVDMATSQLCIRDSIDAFKEARDNG